ncbi:AcrR family transcriptional regulator [Catenulispora sp. GAS73]|uniref:TetR/AcrR family transcriptional regulator n=1 Tax=Catenulispora sp. GAS73 TaxID=3156269 RepID=UPI00351971E1
MPRVKTSERRQAVLDAAMRLFVEQGLGAPTGVIARESGLSTGSLFNYFATKTDLLNELYLHLKQDLAAAVWSAPFPDGPLRDRALEGWNRWTRWGAEAPVKQRALMALETSPDITADSRSQGSDALQGLGKLFEEVHAVGPLAQQPLEFAVGLVAALAVTTMQFMASEPADQERRCRAGFDAAWSVIAGPITEPEGSHHER